MQHTIIALFLWIVSYLGFTSLVACVILLFSKKKQIKQSRLVKGSCLIIRPRHSGVVKPWIEQLKIKEVSKCGKYGLMGISSGKPNKYGWHSLEDIVKETQGAKIVSGNVPIKNSC